LLLFAVGSLFAGSSRRFFPELLGFSLDMLEQLHYY